jgi:hypothetical protein
MRHLFVSVCTEGLSGCFGEYCSRPTLRVGWRLCVLMVGHRTGLEAVRDCIHCLPCGNSCCGGVRQLFVVHAHRRPLQLHQELLQSSCDEDRCVSNRAACPTCRGSAVVDLIGSLSWLSHFLVFRSCAVRHAGCGDSRTPGHCPHRHRASLTPLSQHSVCWDLFTVVYLALGAIEMRPR